MSVCRIRQIQDTLWACNQSFRETVEHSGYMHVGVGVSFERRVRLLLLEESGYKSQCNTTGLNCYIDFCRVFVILLGPYINSGVRLSILWSLISRPKHVYEHGRKRSRSNFDS